MPLRGCVLLTGSKLMTACQMEMTHTNSLTNYVIKRKNKDGNKHNCYVPGSSATTSDISLKLLLIWGKVLHPPVLMQFILTHSASLHDDTLHISEPPSFLMLVTDSFPPWIVSPTWGCWYPHVSFFIPSSLAPKSQFFFLRHTSHSHKLNQNFWTTVKQTATF